VTLRGQIARLTWRLRLVVFLRLLAACAMWALVAAALVTGIEKLFCLGVDVWPVAGGLAAAAPPAALLWMLVRRGVGRRDAARAADRALGLSDRLSSALELGRADGPWAEAVSRDAERHAADLAAARVFPIRATWPARLLVPAAIVLVLVALLPSADLLGRRARRAAQVARSETAAREAAHELLPDAAPDVAGSGLGALRLALVRIGRDLRAGSIDDARRVELGETLRRLAARLAAEGAEDALVESIRRTADALAEGREDALAGIRQAERELARLERELERAGGAPTTRQVETMAAGAHGAGAVRPAGPPGEGEDELVELTAAAQRPPESEPAGGIIYSTRATGGAAENAAGDVETAARQADLLIETGRIPPGHAKLVRDYFTAIRPAE